MSDLELLQTYARTQSHDAFAALVRRHLDLVYSAALRQVRQRQLAEEVAQSVFLDLARQAPRLPATQPLVAWLFVVTHRTAVDAIRREARRAAREQTAADLAAMTTPSPSWLRLREVIDEALEDLESDDRTALLLRFFENHSLRDVGTTLGLSEDAAQKRVSRALDRLRSALDRRGLAATSVVSLASDLSAHAVAAAPDTLAATLGSPAFFDLHLATASVPVSSASSGWSFAQKTAAALALAGVAGVLSFEGATVLRQRDALAALPARSAQLTTELADLQARQARLTHDVEAARTALAIASRPPGSDPELEQAIAAWIARVERLRDVAATRPDLSTPEVVVLSEREWFAAAKEVSLDTNTQVRDAFTALRKTARDAFAAALDDALDRYVDTHDGQLPDSPAALAALTRPPLDPALLRDYEMLQRGPLRGAPKDAWLLAEKPAAAARHGTRIYVATGKHGAEDLAAAPKVSAP